MRLAAPRILHGVALLCEPYLLDPEPDRVRVIWHTGWSGGRHAVLHLENVLTELHAVTIRDGLAFPNYFLGWEDGRPVDEAAAGYAKTLLDQLAWWADGLRLARAQAPYPA